MLWYFVRGSNELFSGAGCKWLNIQAGNDTLHSIQDIIDWSEPRFLAPNHCISSHNFGKSSNFIYLWLEKIYKCTKPYSIKRRYIQIILFPSKRVIHEQTSTDASFLSLSQPLMFTRIFSKHFVYVVKCRK